MFAQALTGENQGTEIGHPIVTNDPAGSEESTSRRMHGDEQQVEETSPVKHSSPKEPQFQDAAVDLMPETDYRAFEREDSPMSSQDEETGQDDLVVQGDELPDEASVDPPEALADVPDALDAETTETDVTDELLTPPEDAIAAFEVRNSQATEEQPVLDQLLIAPKRKVGRIMLRLPLHPVIVKIEPADEQDSVPQVETETPATAHTEGVARTQPDASEAQSDEERDVVPPQRGCEDQELDSPQLQKQSLASAGQPQTNEVAPDSNDDGSESQDVNGQADIQATAVASDAPEPIREEPTTVPLEGSPVPDRLSDIAPAAPVLHADSPFQMRNPGNATAATALTTSTGSSRETTSKRLFRESVSSISVTSEDPRAAARAAALLKLVCEHRRIVTWTNRFQLASLLSNRRPGC